jgi:hypothetical protein
MHKNFADWYDAVSLRPEAKTLELRWQAVEVLAEELKVSDAPSLVRAFFSLGNDSQYLEAIRTAARNADQTYVSNDDQNELTVLAGGAIASVVSQSSAAADAVALAISCLDAQGLRKSRRLQGVVDVAMRYLADESVKVRTVEKLPVEKLDVAALNTLIDQRGGTAVSDVASVWTGLDVVLKKFLAEYKKFAESASSLNNAQTRQREESEILWWLFSEHTMDGSKAFSDLGIPEACVWGPRDLSALTTILPGPIAAPAFLHKMLRIVNPNPPKLLKLSESIEACDLDWKRRLAQKVVVQETPDLCPVLFAVAKSAEVGGAPTWTAAFEYSTGLPADGMIAPVHLAMQVYNESLLLRALKLKG